MACLNDYPVTGTFCFREKKNTATCDKATSTTARNKEKQLIYCYRPEKYSCPKDGSLLQLCHHVAMKASWK